MSNENTLHAIHDHLSSNTNSKHWFQNYWHLYTWSTCPRENTITDFQAVMCNRVESYLQPLHHVHVKHYYILRLSSSIWTTKKSLNQHTEMVVIKHYIWFVSFFKTITLLLLFYYIRHLNLLAEETRFYAKIYKYLKNS